MSAWRPWGPEAFAEAKRSGRPLLAARGSAPPRELAGEAEAGRFIAVLADPEARPDAAERVGAGQALVLSPDGERRGVLPLSGVDLAAGLSRLAGEAGAPERPTPAPAAPVWTGAVTEAAPPRSAGDLLTDYLAGRPDAGAEPEHLAALLAHAAEGASVSALGRALDDLLASPAWDARLGRFRVEGESPLLANASRGRLLWEAHGLTGEPRLRAAAEASAAFLLRELYDPAVGAFRRAPGAGAVYPAEGNARAAYALIKADAFGVAGAGEAAAKALTFLRTRLYDPLLGLVHGAGGGEEAVHGLLGDAAWTALAFTEAFLATGLKAHREFADATVRFLFQELWERERGGFLDRVARPDDPPVLREAHLPPEANAVALETCWRLQHLKGVANYGRWLTWGLAGVWPAAAPARRAGLARVSALAARGRADFELVGRAGEPAAVAILAALNRLHLPRKVVSFVDPDDQDYLLAHKLHADSFPRLFGCAPDLRKVADAGGPEGVPAVVAAVLAAGRPG
ncbi:MAG: hypothetical protein SF051_10990 [Elusimicrobiota bacterium]|nr:hypothetical protein [Elusimicrobiota bacterium]